MNLRTARAWMTGVSLALVLVLSSPAAGIADDADDTDPTVGCATVTIVWFGITPQIGEELDVTPGVAVTVVGSYLWIQFVTGEPSSTANVHSVEIAPDTAEMTVCTTLHDSSGPDIPIGPDAPVDTVVVEPAADDDDHDDEGDDRDDDEGDDEGDDDDDRDDDRRRRTIVFLEDDRDLVERWVIDHFFVIL